ncbi:hypothetical protein COU60_05240 [Candidatus Pacearchaeota archaeon CG10_big_fil_rev_8_21_14_0_10_34_76]|nr:MAG: hypothetical protein COU60_05240 [Candidatus Pacearchaeota archaeon CG10_big_fil_rev_8_21_14_0_10_34_76]
MSKTCKYCGESDCKKHSFFVGQTKKVTEFSGSSPPEIFVGRWNYPNVYTGILSPTEYGNTEIMSSPELWHRNQLAIDNIIQHRNKLIYARTQSNIKKLEPKFKSVFNEIAMTHKSVATEFKLKKAVNPERHPDSRVPLISKAAPIESVSLQENTKIQKKVDYLVNDTDVKSAIAIQELYKSNIQTSNIIKLLSAGLLGVKRNRKLVPTRWAITATDDTLSKNKLEKIKFFQEISEYLVFNAEYLGNHYEFLLIPEPYSFEVIEISLKFSGGVWRDYESIFKRKKYADSVTGAYYANRLALTEYLEKIQKQASCLVLREIRPEYYAPCGVGILREASRAAFTQPPRKFSSIKEALSDIQTRLKQPIENYTNKSWLLNQQRQQTKLSRFLN